MSNNIFFSIIIPNYNNAEWLSKSINSILEQTFTNYEIIIVDDCSTDNSIDIIKQYNNIKLIQCKEKAFNGGSRNLGIKKAQGTYILFLDSDDWFYNKDCFKTIYDIIQNNNTNDAIFSRKIVLKNVFPAAFSLLKTKIVYMGTNAQ